MENKLVITVGGANGERVLSMSPDNFRWGRKHTIPSTEGILAGGSSVNHSCRLLSMGIDVFPVMSVANDAIGQIVHQSLEKAAGDGNSTCRFDPPDFYMNHGDIQRLLAGGWMGLY